MFISRKKGDYEVSEVIKDDDLFWQEYAYIKINTLDELIKIEKITGHELIITNDDMYDIEIYDNWRE